ncbi:MAG: choice-of-anchor L domain-containing protein [Brumimicrobium sp.]|nr:choice-of-anchor L domain-containing protein [Brumimicrobium sp.]MCO5269998.1 choice-of-anchor L domain-containing protein [Brumimicrobium sp.]
MKNWLKLLVGLLILNFINSNSFGQNIQLINPTMTPAQAVQNVLLGQGVTVSNIKYNGSTANANVVQQSVKEFSYTGSVFPLNSGVFLRTQTAPSISDPDLTAIAGSPTNGTIIEFDFIPDGDTLSFSYIFASSEYSGYTCSSFNDAFGFFLSGPGISGPFQNGAVNLATIPNSNTPVGINSVNSGVPSGFNSPASCLAANPNFVADAIYFTTSYNSLFTSSGTDGFNGATVKLSANSNLVCGQTYHIKMAICNNTDIALDSGVFLEAGSFSSAGVEISIEADVATSAGNIADTMLVEGCSQGTIYFTRPSNQTGDSLVVHFTTGGTSTQGVDYPPLAPGDSIIFLPGQDTVTLVIAPTQDGLTEGAESIIISTYTLNACGDTIYAEGTIWIIDEPYSTVHSLDTLILCANDSVPLWAYTTGGFEPYTYTWDNGSVGDTGYVSILQNGTYDFIVTSTDACGFQYTDTSTVVMNQTLAIDTMLTYIATCGKSDGAVSGIGSGFTGTPKYTWTGPGNDSLANSISASVYQNIPSGWYYFTIKDNVCEVNDSIFLDQTPPPNASFTADPNMGGSPLNTTFTNTSDYGTGYTYNWDFGNGQTNNVNDLSSQYSTYIDEGTYTVTLVVSDGACSNTASQEVIVFLPLIYDTPNVFTPNGDGNNDYFTLNLENVERVEVVILNRWGNVVFESDDVNFKWNGKVNNTGTACSEGTYFYKAMLYGKGKNGKEVEVHGFVELLGR